MALEEEGKRSEQAVREAEAARRLSEKERQERTAECLSWREKHQELADRFRAQEDLKALRQSKAVRTRPILWLTHHCWPEGDKRNGGPVFKCQSELSAQRSVRY